MIHNRTSKVIDPISRKTRIRPNADSEWVIQDVPELRIIPEELWQAVQERRAQSFGTPFSRQQRPKRLLSGLGVCGICGARWIVFGKERWGCSGHRNGRGCTNSKSITTASFERRVLRGLQEKMLDPDLVKAFVTEYHQEFARRTADQAARRWKLERQIDEEGRKIQRLVAAIANGAEFDEIKSALAKAQQARERCKLELSELAAVPVIALHPEIAKTYRRQVTDLTRSLTSDEQTTLQAQTIIRSLIDQVILYPRDAER
ncbi:hypothetical protein FMM79_08850 [Novosphingobium sp. BW1]|nr:hypothetical protein FMM79_08850 [Novosphingobium sp. BW1]